MATRQGLTSAPLPAAWLVAMVDPAVLRVAVDLEQVDFVRIQHQQTEIRAAGVSWSG